MCELQYTGSNLKAVQEKKGMFFSLVDYRNNLFMSRKIDDILSFYDSIDTKEKLINWMRERPKGEPIIHEIEGDKDIIVVVLTADFHGNYSKEIRESTFKGLHIIFVESRVIPDFYFNIAHYLNTGIKKAMEYKPAMLRNPLSDPIPCVPPILSPIL